MTDTNSWLLAVVAVASVVWLGYSLLVLQQVLLGVLGVLLVVGAFAVWEHYSDADD